MKKPLISLVVILVFTIVADQVSKQWAQKTLLDNGFFEVTDDYPVCGNANESLKREMFIRRHRENISVIDGFFRMRYVENCASAFGLMGSVPETLRFPFFLVVSCIALGFIPYLYIKTPPEQRLMLYGLPFILGGAIGNLLDRLIFRYVIDFIEWYIRIGEKVRQWPTFNIADVAIVVGIGLMILQMIPRKQGDKGKESSQVPHNREKGKTGEGIR